MTDEELDRTDVVLDLLGEGQRVADETREALPQGVVEALDVVGFPCFLCDRLVALCRDDALVYFILVRVKCGVVLMDFGDRSPQGFGTLATLIADVKRNNLARGGRPWPTRSIACWPFSVQSSTFRRLQPRVRKSIPSLDWRGAAHVNDRGRWQSIPP